MENEQLYDAGMTVSLWRPCKLDCRWSLATCRPMAVERTACTLTSHPAKISSTLEARSHNLDSPFHAFQVLCNRLTWRICPPPRPQGAPFSHSTDAAHGKRWSINAVTCAKCSSISSLITASDFVRVSQPILTISSCGLQPEYGPSSSSNTRAPPEQRVAPIPHRGRRGCRSFSEV